MTDELLAQTLTHLGALVACDTRNPPREIDTGGIFDYIRQHLPDFECTLSDHGAGAVSLLAVRGKPTTLFNVHLDTVPAAPGWSQDPHQLQIHDDRAVGSSAFNCCSQYHRRCRLSFFQR